MKFSGSWKTVTGSSVDLAPSLASSELIFGSEFSFSGEMGMVSSGTGELALIVGDALSVEAIKRGVED